MNESKLRPRKRYRVQARPAQWTNADGTVDQIIKLFGGSRGSMALDYSELPRLIADLAQLQVEYQKGKHDK